MIQIDLITGFLGSGKTTFIKKYAAYLIQQGMNIGILENDYGAVNVDMMLMQELQEAGCGLEMVAGGCDADCHRRRFKTKLIAMGMSGYDRVLVEPSGIFDVDEFFDALHEEPLDRWYEIGNVLAIVDARLEDDMSEQSDYLLASQAANAGRIIFSHVQEVSETDLLHTVEHINRALERVKCKRRFTWQPKMMNGVLTGQNAIDSAVGESEVEAAPGRAEGKLESEQNRESKQEVKQESEIFVKDWSELDDTDLRMILHSGYRVEDYVKYLEEDSGYSSIYFMNVRIPLEELHKKVEALMRDSACGQIFRIKGFMMIADDSWVELNATHKQITIKPIPKGQEIMIVIGENLVESVIREYWQDEPSI